MDVDSIEIFYGIIIILSIALAVAAVIFIGWYLLWILLITGTVGGAGYACYQIFELWKKAHRVIR